jgi:hypothetical protein
MEVCDVIWKPVYFSTYLFFLPKPVPPLHRDAQITSCSVRRAKTACCVVRITCDTHSTIEGRPRMSYDNY